MKNRLKHVYMISIVMIVLSVCLIFWDNHRIIVVEETIVLEQLPSQFEDFKIVQISDLHEREFGKDQHQLMSKINDINYDMIVFTGDMLSHSESDNVTPFYSILEQIDDGENVFVVPGNSDPAIYEEKVGEKSAFVKGIEERGATFLETMHTIERAGEKIHIVNFELAIVNDPYYIGKTDGSFQIHYKNDDWFNMYHISLWQDMKESDIFHSTDLMIALNHFPIPDARVNHITQNKTTEWRDFDLIIAGHYHGGQIRIPFIGALFIPDPWYERSGFFPPQDRVMGQWEYNGTKQYVSAGLGMSDAVPIFKFRLFNPPEINVLTLKRK